MINFTCTGCLWEPLLHVLALHCSSNSMYACRVQIPWPFTIYLHGGLIPMQTHYTLPPLLHEGTRLNMFAPVKWINYAMQALQVRNLATVTKPSDMHGSQKVWVQDNLLGSQKEKKKQRLHKNIQAQYIKYKTHV